MSRRRLRVSNNVTLDGVMQAPAGPEEDLRGGFAHGGWANEYFDPVMAEVAAEGIERGSAFLFGRRTYQHFAGVWPFMPADNPFASVLNESPKHVVSSTLSEPLEWRNASLVLGDPIAAVGRLKEEDGPDLVILGSGQLIRSLLPSGLIDELRLQIHPLVLGAGMRLFDDGTELQTFRLVETKSTTTGVIIATYEPAGAAGG
jgi:dihydrofolate reductase